MARECCLFFKYSEENLLDRLYVKGIDGKCKEIPLRTPIDFIEFKSEVAREWGVLVDDFKLMYDQKLLNQEILERKHSEIFKWGYAIRLIYNKSYYERRESSSSCDLM